MDLLPSNIPSNNIIEPSPNGEGKKRASADDAYDHDSPSTPARHDSAIVSDDVNIEVGEAASDGS